MSSNARGPGRPPDDAKRDTRAEILRAAERMFGSAGYEATSLRQIASAANYDLATLKYHFGDKANLFTEVYRRGHAALVEKIAPQLESIRDARTKQQLRVAFEAFIEVGMDFVEAEASFVRLALYRILEDSEEVTEVEAEIEGLTVGIIESSMAVLRERALIREIDLRPFIVFILIGTPMWDVTTRTNPALVMGGVHQRDAWRPRAQKFLLDLVTRTLLDAE